jgi:C-terminal processing protease CtpA/Prc
MKALLYVLWFTVIFAFSLLSCRKESINKPVISDYEIINSWIEENMKYYYLWNDRINTKELDKNENPEQYFKRLIVPEDDYSRIEHNFKSLLNLSENKKPGYAFFLYSTDTDDVLGKIAYVVKKSPADSAGLKRGLIFTKVNGTGLSVHNYQDLTAKMLDKHTLTVRNKNGSETDCSVSVAEFPENPVFLDTVYNIDNRRIGYLVYNSFVSDNNDFSQEYDMRLNDVFGKFKNENINELILDLRYNAKGHIFSSMIMASLIIPPQDIGDIYAKYQYNKSLQQIIRNRFGNDYLNLYYTNVINGKAVNNIGDKLDRVFILTSPKTGIMSEILVNGLKLSTDVVVVGSKTGGKNMFAFFLYEKDPEKQKINTWSIVPVVLQISNKAGNTDMSFSPDVAVMEPLYDDTPLGNIDEKVLSTAMNAIFGASPAHHGYGDIKTEIIPQQSSVNYLQSLSTNSIPCR